MIHVLLVNEQRLFNEAIHSLLSTEQDIQVSGMVTDGIKAMQFIEEYQPDVVVLDTHITSMNGIQLTVHIKEKFPQIKVVLLSEAIKEELVIQGVIAGADAFLIKTIDAHGLIQAIYDTYNNEIVFSGEVAKILATRISELARDRKTTLNQKIKNRHVYLTKRELDVAYLLVDHMSNQAIARELYISEGTVKNYVVELYQKFGIHRRRELSDYLHSLLNPRNHDK